MRLEECRPCLAGRMKGGVRLHITRNGPFGDLESQFEQLSPDPFGTPEWILTCRLTNKRDDLSRKLSLTLGLVLFNVHEQSKALAVPAEQRGRLHNQKHVSPR